MLRTLNVLAACAVAICQPAAACNKEGFDLPWDLAEAETVVVVRMSNFRIVPNDAESQRIRQAVEAGTAESWQKKQYQESLSKGASPGGYFGLFDVSVREVLKGTAARHFSVIFPNARLCCFGGNEPSMLPSSMPDQVAIIGLRKNRDGYYNGLELPLLYTDSCVGPMLFSAKAGTDSWELLKAARRHFGSKRKD
jgi:hypothetical protein